MIRDVDGMPCIVLPEGVLEIKIKIKPTIKHEPETTVRKTDFHYQQTLKEQQFMKEVLRELMEKFRKDVKDT